MRVSVGVLLLSLCVRLVCGSCWWLGLMAIEPETVPDVYTVRPRVTIRSGLNDSQLTLRIFALQLRLHGAIRTVMSIVQPILQHLLFTVHWGLLA